LKAIKRFRRALLRRGVRPAKIILYGSQATGTTHAASDIDLVVVSKDFEGRGFWARIEILSAAIYDVLEPIEAVGMTPDEWERGDSPLTDYARRGEGLKHPGRRVTVAR